MRTFIILLIIAAIVATGSYQVSKAVDNFVKPTLQEMGWLERGGDLSAD